MGLWGFSRTLLRIEARECDRGPLEAHTRQTKKETGLRPASITTGVMCLN